MVSWTTMGYSMGLRSIEAAYRSSRDGFKKELSGIDAEWGSLVEEKNSADGDEFEEYVDQYKDHLSDQVFDLENGIRLIREAFLLTLYHYWEKESCSLLNLKKVDHKELCKKIRSDGRIDLAEAGINRLYLIANTIKHNNGYPLYEQAPDLFSAEAAELDQDERIGWHTFLRLEDKDFIEAIDAVRASGPGANWKDDGGLEISEDFDGSSQ